MREEDREEDLGAALAALRAAAALTQAEVARAAGLPASSISEYEGGRKVPSGRTLERIVSGMALPPSLLETALGFVRLVRASKGGDRSMADAAARLGSATAKLARSTLEICAPAPVNLEERMPRPAEEDRLHAAALWERLRRYGARERRAILQEAPEFRSWALCELIREESVKAADGPEGAALAELALWIAGLLPGEERWRSRVERGPDESRRLAVGPPILGE